MEGLREQVDRRDLDGGEGAFLDKALEVARQGGRVAAHVGDIAGACAGDEVDGLGCQARARRVDHQNVGILIGELAHGVAANDVDIIELIDLEVAAQVAHGRAIGLNGGDKIAAAGERQGKGAGAAVQVHSQFVFLRVERVHDKFDQNLGTLGVDLEERRGRKAHLALGDILGPRALAGEHLDLGDAAGLLLALAHHAHDARGMSGVCQYARDLRAWERARGRPECDLERLGAARGANAHALKA